jgi:hypothetical protein
MMLSCIRGGAGTREALMRALSGVREYRGLRSRIGFTEGRVNGWLTILHYAQDTIQRLDEIRVE